MITREQLKEIGFKEIPTFNVQQGMIYDLGRYRQLSIGSIGGPNEMMFICEVDHKDERKITDLVCVHNYDYDGYITIEKIKDLIKLLT